MTRIVLAPSAWSARRAPTREATGGRVLLPAGACTPPADWLHADAERIYVTLRSHGAGDVINLVPLVKELAARHPRATLFVVTNHHTLPFDRCAPNVRVLAELPGGEVLDGVRACHLDLEPYVRYHLICPHWLQYLLIAGVGSVALDADPFPLLGDDEALRARLGAEPYVLLHARNTRVDWQGRNTDLVNLARVVARLRARGLRVWAIGNDAVPGDGDVPHLGQLSAAALVQAARGAVAFVGIDSFPMHVAALFDKPILGFFGATYPSVVLTPVTRLVVLRHPELACHGCVYVKRPIGYNVCHFGDERCGERLPDGWLDAQTDRLLHLIDTPAARVDSISHEQLEFQLRAQQSIYEEALLIENLRRRLPSERLRERLAGSRRFQQLVALWRARGQNGPSTP